MALDLDASAFPAEAGGDGAPGEEIILGRRLYEKMEQLDPSPVPIAWDDLSDREREYYRLCALEVAKAVGMTGG